MIGPTGAVRVMVATKPVDFRKGAEGLAALVRETRRADPFSGAIYQSRFDQDQKTADKIDPALEIDVFQNGAFKVDGIEFNFEVRRMNEVFVSDLRGWHRAMPEFG